MPDTGAPKKTYVRPDNTAVLTCTHCGRQKVVLADSFKGYKHKLKVKCSCNKVFTVNLEFRNRVRKRTYLRGKCTNHSQEDKETQIAVLDLSVTGLAFTCLNIKQFNLGDELTLSFELDDEHLTKITKKMVVRNFRQKSVGCMFEIPEETFGSQLGYYITQAL